LIGACIFSLNYRCFIHNSHDIILRNYLISPITGKMEESDPPPPHQIKEALPNNGGSEEGGDQSRILWGNPMRWAILSDNTFLWNASIKPNHYSKLKLQKSQNIFDLFDTTIKLW
jgi:hypothetical protein